MVQGASKLNMHPRVPEQPKKGLPRQVVYAPACVTRMMGPAASDTEQGSVHEKLLSLFDKAGYEVIYPEVSLHPSMQYLPALCYLCRPACSCITSVYRCLSLRTSKHCSYAALPAWSQPEQALHG